MKKFSVIIPIRVGNNSNSRRAIYLLKPFLPNPRQKFVLLFLDHTTNRQEKEGDILAHILENRICSNAPSSSNRLRREESGNTAIIIVYRGLYNWLQAQAVFWP